MASNPYRKVEKTFKVIGNILLIGLTAVTTLGFLVGIPIGMLASGLPWYEALIPWWIVIGIALLTIFCVGLIFLWDKYIATPWKRDKASWDEGHRS